MGMMPLSTYKPPTFSLVEDFFNDSTHGLMRRWAALQKLITLPNPNAFDPASGLIAPVAPDQISHFKDHWLDQGDTGGWYWPTFMHHRGKILARLVEGFSQSLAYSVIPTDQPAPLDPLANPVQFLGKRPYRRLDMMWVCAHPSPTAAVFDVRPLVYDCEVSVMFLTPWPDKVVMDTSADLGSATAAVARVEEHGDPAKMSDFIDPVAYQAADKEIKDAAASRASLPELDPACCPSWALAPEIPVLSELVGGLSQLVQQFVVPWTADLLGEDFSPDPDAVAEFMQVTAADDRHFFDQRMASAGDSGLEQLLRDDKDLWLDSPDPAPTP